VVQSIKEKKESFDKKICYIIHIGEAKATKLCYGVTSPPN